MKLRLPWTLAAFAAAFCPVSLICQNNSEPDTSPKTQEEANRILQHGALPKYSKISPGRSLRELLIRSPGNPAEVRIGEGVLANSPQGHAEFFHDWIEDQVCRADLVVVARMDKTVSALTSDESLVDTDYYFTAGRILHSRSPSALPSQDSTIVVNDVGGTIDLPEGRASTHVLGLTSPEPGKRYLLFLKNIVDTRDYEPTGFDGAFLVPESGPPRNLYRQTQRRLDPYLSKLDSTSLINLVGAAVASSAATGCKGAPR